ncbi:MAG: hypothetical protein M0Q95_20310 [Porticoccaceae bacterium]|nr:hypothetical protein [Porticoccaceae bacterium]
MNPHIAMAQRRAANRRAHSPSHEGRAPRTLYEAFEDPSGLVREQDPTLSDVIWDIVGLVVFVAIFGLMAFAGAAVFGA